MAMLLFGLPATPLIFSRLAEGTLYSLIQIINKDFEKIWPSIHPAVNWTPVMPLITAFWAWPFN